MTGYWRIRLKDGTRHDFSEDAWNRNEVGVWYGAWSAHDLSAAEKSSFKSNEIADFLNNLPKQRELDWDVSADFVNTARRFRNIPLGDWVVLYLPSTQEIGLARVDGGLTSASDHPLNSNGELFKTRSITEKKIFPITRLPDAYRLIPTQGRGNVHQFNSMWEHVRILADHNDCEAVNSEFRAFPFDTLLEMLGASAWESFALAYLIMEHEFIPTGLSTGRTLPIADIVGRQRTSGSRIIAQCKKHSTPHPIDSDFLNLSSTLQPNDLAFYFAYGGCSGDLPDYVRIIDRVMALEWAGTENGRLYRDLLLQD